jgi:asparagine synthase (glutamine-hydrolysing)
MATMAGVLCWDGPVDEQALLAMCQGLSPGEAPGGSVLLDAHIGLASCRRQPGGQMQAGDDRLLRSEDGGLCIALCGGLDNQAELRVLLEAKGHRFRSGKHAEVILHAYQEWGEECLEHLQGGFAFGLWDAKEQALLLARDRVGLKPLYYCRAADEFYFASELPALLECGATSRQLNQEALEHYFTLLFIPAPLTIFEGICRLAPASSLLVRRGSQDVRTYWQLPEAEREAPPQEAPEEALLHLLEDAVARQMAGDDSPGVLLSGGLDSSTVLAMACRARSGLRAFSAGLQPGSEDLRDARQVASYVRARLREINIAGVQPQVLGQLARLFGEPHADSSSVPFYLLIQELGTDLHTVLAGSGGDEVFAGHRRYRRLALDGDHSLEHKFNSCNQMDQAQKERLFTFQPNPELSRHLLHQHLSANRGHDLHSILKFDFEVRLPGLLLSMNHVVGAAHGIEIRSPLLDAEVVAFAAALPLAVRLGRGQQFELKKLLRDTLRRYDLLPRAVIDRPKRGFGAPLHDWLRGEMAPFADSILRSKHALCWGVLQRPYVQQRWKRFQEGADQEAYLFWKVLILETWMREFMA